MRGRELSAGGEKGLPSLPKDTLSWYVCAQLVPTLAGNYVILYTAKFSHSELTSYQCLLISNK